jgi:pSer/pThr/pTyr-binding forkhead associated (FHA) protein
LETWPALPPPAAAPPPDPRVPLGPLRLRLNNGKSFELKGRTSYLIGRRDDERGIVPELDLSNEGGLEGGVSRAHAVIHVTPAGYTIEDLQSTNETLLNFSRLLPRQQYPVKDGDQLRLGTLTMLVIIS